MRRSIENAAKLVEAMMKNDLGLVVHYQNQGDNSTARIYRAKAAELSSVLTALSSKDDFDKYCDIYF